MHLAVPEVFMSAVTVPPVKGYHETPLLTSRDASTVSASFIGAGVPYLSGSFVEMAFNMYPTGTPLRCDLTPEAVGQARLAIFFFLVLPTPPTDPRVGSVFTFVLATFDQSLTGLYSSYAGPRTITNYPPILSIKAMVLSTENLDEPVVFEEYKVGPIES
jgi:hypothetical protein